MTSNIDQLHKDEAPYDKEKIAKVKALLKSNRFTFSFRGSLENEFKHHMLTKYAALNRFYPLLGALGLVLFIIGDWVVIPSILPEVASLRIAGALMILSFVYIAHRPAFFGWIQAGLAIGSLLVHLLITYIAIRASQIGEFHYQFGPIIPLIFLCSALRIKFAYVLPTAIAMTAVQFYSAIYLMNMSFSQQTENVFIFGFVALVSLLMNATVEHEVRKGFLQQILLNAEQAELIQAQVKLHNLSISDSLTGLFNRRYLNQFIEREWQSALRHQHDIAVIMIDVDEFKRYNDNHGHLKGDEILVQVSQAIKSVIHRPDDMLARYGGEEFVAVLAGSDMEAGKKVAEAMREAVENLQIPHPSAQYSDVVTISLGVSACIPSPLYSSQVLIKAADDALYQAKKAGRNTIRTQMIVKSETE